jgi:hypothetical protein
MEDTLKDFDTWIETLPPITVEYYVIFDPTTGKITGIYPDHAATEIKNKILIDTDIAESVFEGKITLNSYMIDLTSDNLEFIEIQTLNKIDDVLHRVVDKQWTNKIDNDVFLTYDRTQSIFIVELAKKYNGTRIVEDVQSKKVHWTGSTEMLFLLTAYNDPNYLNYSISVTLDELIEKKKVIDNIVLPKKFSVYTRRLFKNYIIEEL